MTSPQSMKQTPMIRGVLTTATVVLAVLLGLVLLMTNGIEPRNSAPDPVVVHAQYVTHVADAGTRCPAQGITAQVIAAQLHAESAWNFRAVSPVGAQGLAQFMPGTWERWGTDYDQDGTSSPFDPPDAIGSQADYLCHLSTWAAQQRQQGTITGDPLNLTLAAYNAGPANVEAHGGVPPFPETQDYIARIHQLIPYATAN